MRPLGGYLFGRIGDKKGRKASLTYSLVCMGLGTLIIGITPVYSSIGILAPIFVVLGRMLQGISLGGELAGGIIFAYEHTGIQRKGLAVSLVASGHALGGFLGSSISMLCTLSFMPTWGWRVPFLLGFLISGLGRYMRNRLLESPEFCSLKKNELASEPLLSSINVNGMKLFMYVIFSGVGGALYYLNFVYFPTFITPYAFVSNNFAQITSSCGIFAVMVVLPIFGILADIKSRLSCLSFGLTMLIITTFLRYLFMPLLYSPVVLLITSIFAGIFFALFLAGWYPFGTALFKTNVRYSSSATASSLGLSLISGTSPLIAGYLISLTNGLNYFSGYLLLLSLLAVYALFLAKKSTQQTTTYEYIPES